MLPDNIINGLTLSNLQIASVRVVAQPQFGIMSISNIHTVPEVTTDNRGDKSFVFLVGTLVNTGTVDLGTGISGVGITPVSITIQIFKRTSDGSLTLVGGGNPLTSPSITTGICPMPPPGESIIFYVPLWQNITIKDGQKGTIDGEITIVAPSN